MEEKKASIVSFDINKILTTLLISGILSAISMGAGAIWQFQGVKAKTVDLEKKIKENKETINTVKTAIKKVYTNQCEMAILQFGKRKAIKICKPIENF